MIEFGPVRGGDIRRDDRRTFADAKTSSGAKASPDTKSSPCRDLVAVGHASARDSVRQMSGTRSSAAFLAHLIATAAGLPQTREKRRLAPEEGSRLYAAAQARVPVTRARLGSL
jgi:hypothetical protein